MKITNLKRIATVRDDLASRIRDLSTFDLHRGSRLTQILIRAWQPGLRRVLREMWPNRKAKKEVSFRRRIQFKRHLSAYRNKL